MYKSTRKKIRGQKRKLKQLIQKINDFNFNSFWNRNNDYQRWIPIRNRSLQQERLFITDLKEQGYIEIIHDEDLWYKTELWFYGELMESDGGTILEYK